MKKDGDVQMNNLDADSRGRPTQHRTAQDRPKTYGPNAKTRWYKIRLRNTKDKGYDKAGLLQFFAQELEIAFHAINFVQEETSILFWIQGDALADSFKAIHNRASLPDGAKVNLHVLADHNSPPMADVGDSVVVDALKNVLNTRYTLETQALDLSEFDKNDILRSQGFYIPLTKIATLEALAKVIRGAGVEVKALSLRNNNLGHLTDISNIFGGVHPFSVEILHLGDNQLKYFTELDKLRTWPLKELFLEGNPIQEYQKRDREVLMSAVRKRFPKLKRLDDEDMPVEIGFEVETEEEQKKLPPVQKLGSSSPEALELIKTFLQHYFEIYDKNKQELLPAYHPNSVFSISAALNKAIPHRQPDISAYVKNKGVRNLKINSVWNEDQPAVKSEPLNIVAYLNNLPKTEHDPNSLTIDTGFVSTALLTFVVTGLFREIPSPSSSSSSSSSASSPIRSFSRSFVTIPVGTGMQIINDQLTITNATDAQLRDAFKEPTSVAVPIVVPTDLQALTPEQQALVVEFMKQTNLIEKFALDALQSAGWNFDEARNLFQQHKDKIPPQGFRPL